jgi:hypothetical protein
MSIDLLTRAVNARLRAMRKMRGESTTPGRPGRGAAAAPAFASQTQHQPGVAAAMSIGLGAESKLGGIASSARIFCNELFDSRAILQELRDELLKREKQLGDEAYVEKVDLKRKIEYVNKAIEDVYSGKTTASIERKITSFYLCIQEILKKNSDMVKAAASETSAVQPIPHMRRTQILNVSVDAEGAGNLQREMDRQKIESTMESPDRNVAEKIITELGVQLGVQKQEVCSLEVDACVCGSSMLRSINKSLMVCSSADCGRVKRIIETTASGPGVDDSDTGVANARRSTSIKDFLHKWQAIDRVDIPIAVKRNIAKYIYHELGVKHESQLSYRHVVCAVFEMKLSRDYFDHMSQIWSELTGQPPPQLSFNESLIITSMWRFVQDKFSTVAANHSKFFFFPLIIERFCRLMNFDSVVDFLVPVFSRPSDATTFHAIQAIFEERGYKQLPSPHVYFLHNTASVASKLPIPTQRPNIAKQIGRVRVYSETEPIAKHKNQKIDSETI